MIGWQPQKLGDLCSKITDGSHNPPKSQEQSDFIMLSSRNVFDDQITLDKPRYLAKADFDSENKRTDVQAGDVLLTIVGTVGRVAVVGEDLPKFTLQRSVAVLKTNKTVIIPRFLMYSLRNMLELLLGASRGVAQKGIYLKSLRELQIPVPEVEEQNRIVAILDQAFADIDKARALTERNLKNARELFESTLQQVFSQRGEGWEQTTIGKATGGVFTGPFGSLLHKRDYVENGVPLINPAHITSSGVEPDTTKTVSSETKEKLSSYVMGVGDIVIGRRGEMGRCAQITETEDGYICGTGSFFIKASGRVDSTYLTRYLRSDGCRKRLEKIAGGAVMPNLSNSELSKFEISLPPIDRQRKIAEQIDDLAYQTDQVEKVYRLKNAALDELKKALLHKAFSGELTKDLTEAAA